jgi:hypothetical protein
VVRGGEKSSEKATRAADDAPTLDRLLRSFVLSACCLECACRSAQEQAGVAQPPVSGFHGARCPARCAMSWLLPAFIVEFEFQVGGVVMGIFLPRLSFAASDARSSALSNPRVDVHAG